MVGGVARGEAFICRFPVADAALDMSDIDVADVVEHLRSESCGFGGVPTSCY